MGATGYSTVAAGKTITDAYRRACDEANAYSGHQEGYSGDIQTSNGFTEFVLPKGLTIAKLYKLAQAIEDHQYKLNRWEDDQRWGTAAQKKRKRPTEPAMLANSPHKYFAQRYYDAVDDKWGAAAAIELTGKAAKDWKAANGFKGTRAKVFTFSGTAAC